MNRFVAIFALCTVSLSAQTNRGGIAGTVTDPTDAVVPGATVTITNLRTNEIRKLITSQNGAFSALDLEPVTYRVAVEMQGFKKAVVDNVKIDTATTAAVNIKLETGTASTEIQVSATASVLNTESGTVSSTITERQIQDSPLANRSVLDLAVTLPNVSGDPGTENPSITAGTACPGCNLSVNGGRPLSTLIMSDGVNNTGVSLARTMVTFSPETVQEFTVLTSAYSAEYSTTGGGVINVTTKSGGNDFYGEALWYNRNPAFAAAPYTTATTNRPVSTLKYNQFSLTAGGRVIIPKIYDGKNRTFWFAGFEPNYRRDRLDQYGLVPTDAMRRGDYSGVVNTASGWLPQSVVDQFKSIAPTAVVLKDSTLYNQFNLVNGNQFTQNTLAAGQSYAPFNGNIIPGNMLDATAQKALKYIIEPGAYFLNSNGLISNVITPRRLVQDEKRYTVRIDQVITDKNRLYGRYTTTPIVKTQTASISPTTDTADYSWAKQAMLADTHTFTPTLFNDLRLNYTRGRFSSTVGPEWDANSGDNFNTVLGLPNLTKGGVPLIQGLFPGSSFGGGGSTATGLGSGASTYLEDREERYGITDIVYKVKGNMSWKFGVDAFHSLQNVTPLFAALGGSYTFATNQTNSTGSSSGTGGDPFASFLLGVPNGNVLLRNAEIPYYYRWNGVAGFVQNDWKVKPNLTLNLGFRYNLELPRTEKYNNQGVFRPDLAQTVSLPAPLTLANGQVITSTQVVPFVFAGRGGNSPYLTPPDYKDFEPRFGFAYTPKFVGHGNIVFRGGYGISHVPVSGSFRIPQPDFGATQNFASTAPSSTANPDNVMRLGENPPQLTPVTPAQAIGAPQNGAVLMNSLYYQSSVGGFAISPNYHTPYIQNWDLVVSWEFARDTVLEIGYTGLKGTHLFVPHENLNPVNTDVLTAELANGLSTTATIADPLGRINPATGKVLTVQNGSLGNQYLGFPSLYMLFDASANSIRHAGYINLVKRYSNGILINSNYTYAKSIDDASSEGGDKNILTAVNGQVDGQIAFGGTRANDRSVSTFDQRHVFNNSVVYDLPFGRGRRFLANTWKPLDLAAGGWTMAGIARFNSGFPYIPTIADANFAGDLTHTIRPNIVPGVPLLNPLWSRTCPIGANCQPYLNPAAFERPALGQLGNAPRTLDSVRGPWAQFLDLSIQKNWNLGEGGKRRIQFRVDGLNVLNHPTFRVSPNNAGGTDFMTNAPSTAALSSSDYNTWASANGQPAANTTAGAALLTQINNTVNAQKNAKGVLPLNFFSVPVPQNFWGLQPQNFDIRTLDGFKLFRLRQVYNTGFGDLYNVAQPRYIQFGVKIFF